MEVEALLTFNLLLRKVGIDPKHVYYVRHQDKRSRKIARSMYQVWKEQPESFELYQRLQKRARFSNRKFLVSFVVTPLRETLFIGIYENHGRCSLPALLSFDPVSGTKVNADSHIHYDLRHSDILKGYKERLTIQWGGAPLAWVQKADTNDKAIIEIRKQAQEEPFPGFRHFKKDIHAILSMWPSWTERLRYAKGVYLLTCKDSGKQYVGKADGIDGFYGRFLQYAKYGHGGNSDMKAHKTSGYIASILEVNSTPDPDELNKLEILWKDKLGTRRWGLNKN